MSRTPTVPDTDDFRALARSSPWRWRTVAFTADWTGLYSEGPVRAWIERPDRIRVESLDGRERLDERRDPGPTIGFMVAFDEAELARDPRLAEPAYREAVTADLRRDEEARRHAERSRLVAETVIDEAGLVRKRVTDRFDHDAPMYQNYHWVAMLDPLELTDGRDDGDDSQDADGPGASDGVVPGTVIDEVRVVEHEGRTAWEAVLRTSPAYDPRCACCALLPGEVADLAEDRRSREGAYADAYRVRLDVGTGICVFTEEIGGEHAGAGHRVRIESAGQGWGPEDPPWRTG